MARSDAITQGMDQYLNMCDAGWDVNVIILASIPARWNAVDIKKFFAQRYHCSRAGSVMGIQVEQYAAELGIWMCSKMRSIQKKYLEEYDVFIYQEEDMIVTLSRLHYYVEETAKLEAVLDQGHGDGDNIYMIGFSRHQCCTSYKKIPSFNASEEKITYPKTKQNVMVEKLVYDYKCLGNADKVLAKPYVEVTNNGHQAMSMLTRKDIKMLDARCEYLSQDKYLMGREYVSSLAQFSYMPSQLAKMVGIPNVAKCFVHKLFPADLIQTFGVLHTYTARHVWQMPVVDHVNNTITAGHKMAETNPASSCWKDVQFAA